MDKIVIKRPEPEPKQEIITLRLTRREKDLVNDFKSRLKFDHIREFFLFCKAIAEQLYNWKYQGYHFFIKRPSEQEYTEVKIEFQPPKEPS